MPATSHSRYVLVSGWRAVRVAEGDVGLRLEHEHGHADVIADGRASHAAVHEEAVVDVDEGMDGVDVGDQAARGLRLTDRDEVLGFQSAEHRARVVTYRLPGLGEDVVRVAVTRV